MADVEIKIDGKPLLLPLGFSLPWERVTPALELDTIILGDYTMDVDIPLAGNEHILNNAARIELENRTLVYRAETFHFGRIITLGVALLNASDLSSTNLASVRMSFQSNAFGIESYKVTLAEALTGVTVNLGSTTAAIIGAAKAQNAAGLSADGNSGAVMRFPATFNPDFYGGANPEWYPDNVDIYEFDREYKKGESVLYRFTTNTVLVYLTQNYGPRPYLCTAKEDVTESQTPENTPDKWDVKAIGVINCWNPDESKFEINEEYDPLLKSVNYRTMVPYLQLHDIIRKLFSVYGYQVDGDFMRDPIKRQAIVYSNFSLDKMGPKPNYCRIGILDYDATDTALTPVPFDVEDFPFENVNSHWDGTAYIVPEDGYIEIQAEITWRNDAGVSQGLTGGLSFASPYTNIMSFGDLDMPFIPDGDTQSFVIYHVVYAEAGDEIRMTTTEGPASDTTITQGWISFRHLRTDNLNLFDGQVRYSDHVPDMEIVDFLRALRVGFNLHVTLNPIEKTAVIDYHENAYQITKAPQENTDIANVGYKTKLTQLRRFRMQYGELPEDVFEPNASGEILDPVDQYTDLPIPEAENKAILVKAQNAWYVTQYQFWGTFAYWEYAGQHYPDVNVGASGDLIQITPELGPMSFRRMLLPGNKEVWSVNVNEPGRSAMFNPAGKRPPLRIVYSYTNGYTAGSPYDFGGSFTRKSVMNWERIYTEHFKKTLATIAREERVEMLLKLPLAQLINPEWQRFKLINNVLYEFLKQQATYGANDIAKVEARKVRVEALEIVGVAEEEPAPPELWTPALISTYCWHDASDVSTITIEGGKVSQWDDKSGNNLHAYQNTSSKRPVVSASQINSLNAIQFSGASNINLKITGTSIVGGTVIAIVDWGGYGYFIDGAASGYRRGIRNFGTAIQLIGDNNTSYLSGLTSGTGPSLLGAKFIHNNSRAFVNGVTSAAVPGPSYINTKTTLTFGNWAGASAVMNGWIGEVVQFSNVIDNNTFQMVEGYLAHKWGTQGELDPTHPYKIAPPYL